MTYRMRPRGRFTRRIVFALCAALAGSLAHGAEAPTEQLLSEGCLLRELRTASDDVTAGELRARCAREAEETENSLLLERLRRERAAEGVRTLLTTHKRNYLIPASYSSSPNVDPFADAEGVVAVEDEIDDVEAKFQLSIKVSLAESLLTRRDRIYFGFTALSFWQAYNRHVSAPFRETNYEPEFFWTTPLDWGPLGLDAGVLTVGLSHQSNGRGGSLSRSWNRIYANLQFEKENLVVGLRPWWRIPEDEKDDPTDAIGDDNPDIEDYLGHFDLTTVYRRGDHEWSLLLRGNADTGKGAVQLEWAFPLWRGVRGFAQYFNGYGESLIDYDAHVERIGVGVLLNDLL
ncbi:MAG TPA: phospholipase A [Pseudomonadales bacterium]